MHSGAEHLPLADEETLEILSDKPLMRRLPKAQQEIDAGRVTELGKDAALALIRGRR